MLIGITGSFGCGKTTVARMFARLGGYVIDADRVCHSLMAPSKEVYRKIVEHFGASILGKDKEIDRRSLANIVFKKRSKLNLLNSLIHPHAIKEINRIVRRNKSKKVIFVDAALLIEAGFYKKMDRIIIVRVVFKKQVNRIARSKGMQKKDIVQRIRMQGPLKKKLALADFIIDNSGSKKKTLFQVRKIWKQIRTASYKKSKIFCNLRAH